MNTRQKRQLISLDLGPNGGLLAFRDISEIARFIAREEGAKVARVIQNAPNLKTRYDQVISAGRSVTSDNPESILNFQNALQEAYLPEGRPAVPLSISPVGQLLESLDDEGASGAMAAIGDQVQTQRIVNRPRYLAGVVEYFAVNAINRADHHRSSVNQMISDISEREDRLIGRMDGLLAEAEARLAAGTKRAEETWKTAVKRQFRFNSRARRAFEAAEGDIRNVEKTYTTQMGLQAPVEYWKQKRTRHGTAAGNYRWLLLAYAVIGTIGVSGALWYVAGQITEASRTNAGHGALAYGAIGLLLTTVALWAGRILVRLYMSEHHLAIDAEERATMIETYLALQLKQQVDQKDLLVVLNGMFRPTSDGIIKDDAAPELGAAGLLSKLLGK